MEEIKCDAFCLRPICFPSALRHLRHGRLMIGKMHQFMRFYIVVFLDSSDTFSVSVRPERSCVMLVWVRVCVCV